MQVLSENSPGLPRRWPRVGWKAPRTSRFGGFSGEMQCCAFSLSKGKKLRCLASLLFPMKSSQCFLWKLNSSQCLEKTSLLHFFKKLHDLASSQLYLFKNFLRQLYKIMIWAQCFDMNAVGWLLYKLECDRLILKIYIYIYTIKYMMLKIYLQWYID